MPGEHYFTAEPTGEAGFRPLRTRIAGRDVVLTTANGIFSPDRIDIGTSVLLDALPAPSPGGHLLDLGCGWGPLALTLAAEAPDATVWAVDVNERALGLVRRNAAQMLMENVNAVTPEDVPADLEFATIWSNPPIRVGKDELHGLLSTWLPRLAPGGEAWLVVARALGADSLLRWLTDALPATFEVERVSSSKGFRVIRITRPADSAAQISSDPE